MAERNPNGDGGGRKPDPADPARRRSELPGQAPKPEREDPVAPDLLAAILKSPEYRPAIEDVAFLERPETRGLRLQLDYEKAERTLRERGVSRTIVVVGGTRVPEPATARARVEALEAALAAAPGDAAAAGRLRVARRLLRQSRLYDVARELGRIVGRSEGGGGDRLVILTGGGPGMMEAANRGAHDVGADTVGLNITLPLEQYPNPYVTPGLCFSFHYFAMRKLHFLLRARALVAFPGGFGTLDELFETLTLIQTRKIAPMPVILVGESFWRGVLDPERLVEEGVIDPEDRELFWFAETAQEIWNDIHRWYAEAGRGAL